MRKQVILDIYTEQKQIAALKRFMDADVCNIVGIMLSWGQIPTDVSLGQLFAAADTDVPVYAGCPGPLARHLYQKNAGAAETLDVPDGVQREHAVSFLIQACRNAQTPITVAALGPLTNIGMALRIAPDIAKKIREVIVVDMLREDAFASENLQRDPEAAQIIIRCGVAVSLAQIDVDADPAAALFWLLDESNDSKGEQTHLQICIDRGLAAGALLYNGKRQPNGRIITEEIMNS